MESYMAWRVAGRGVFPNQSVTICHIRYSTDESHRIRFVLFGPDGRVTEWSLTAEFDDRAKTY